MKHYNSILDLHFDLANAGLEISLDRIPFNCYDVIKDHLIIRNGICITRSETARKFRVIPKEEQNNILLCGIFIWLMANQTVTLMTVIRRNNKIKETFLEACLVDLNYYIDRYFISKYENYY